jgi:hypothetical protein
LEIEGRGIIKKIAKAVDRVIKMKKIQLTEYGIALLHTPSTNHIGLLHVRHSRRRKGRGLAHSPQAVGGGKSLEARDEGSRQVNQLTANYIHFNLICGARISRNDAQRLLLEVF